MEVSKRVMLTDGSNRFFFPERCEVIEEGKWYNGRSYVSCATGSEWTHQRLFVTPKGRYILHTYSSDGVRETYEELTSRQAALWVMQNGYELPDSMKPFIEDLEM